MWEHPLAWAGGEAGGGGGSIFPDPTPVKPVDPPPAVDPSIKSCLDYAIKNEHDCQLYCRGDYSVAQSGDSLQCSCQADGFTCKTAASSWFTTSWEWLPRKFGMK
uniref:Uncharacterized protein n=1 Tax=Pyramimonas obovata TaxID=1411642 RepID=A0A7S0RLE8_9CHLO|eukprot:CAMPEP_0118922826 /NCGR_PEP_ID=MMETSP1169-20130426/1609_1 /TAXON_ID=36882 /ORGANISM="Pyramimonas obovata, Strain CCMP722" /LENGTH=104 /DNA_ID=CAMNT_0006863751 /DNA_START=674 /DNA_END=988 /DNA_ORIENTATION=-